MKRLFIAIHIKPEEELLNAFQTIKEQLATERIKWVEEENLHLTLKFIGEVDDDNVSIISNRLKQVTTKGPIEFSIEGVGLLKNMSDPRVIYGGIKNSRKLENLQFEIETLLAEAGFPSSSKGFTPHLTLGRIKALQDKEFIKDLLCDFRNCYLQKVTCHEFILFESLLTPRGPVYKKLFNYPLV